MSHVVAVVGNCGSGKTALTRRLSERYALTPLLEQHEERPFQARFQDDLHQYCLANQIDYLLFRAEQELSLLGSATIAITDGGLDQDFYVFTRLFHRKGLLNAAEYGLCERLYRTLRRTLPPPDLLIRLTAPVGVLAARRASRTRKLDIVTDDDLGAIEELLQAWMAENTVPTIDFDTSADDPDYSATIGPLLAELDRLLSIS